MKILMILISFIAIGQKGIAQDWIYVSSNTEGDKWYIKSSPVPNSGFSSGEIIKIWTKKELKKTTVKKSGKILTYLNAKELQLIEADCNEKKIKFITTTTSAVVRVRTNHYCVICILYGLLKKFWLSYAA